MRAVKETVVFATRWFDLVARRLAEEDEPHYAIRTRDYVTVVALTRARELVLVRQYRPAIGKTTLELPGGHVEPDQTPEEAARKELQEETGYVADRFELLGNLAPDTGRLCNRLWCYLAADAIRPADDNNATEPGIEVVIDGRPVSQLVSEGEFCSALSVAALFLAIPRAGLTQVTGAAPGRREQSDGRSV